MSDMTDLGNAVKAWMPGNGKRTVGRDETHYNVRHYGADPTGVTPSNTALDAIAAKINASGGGRIYFPPGKYTFTAAVTTFTAPVHIYGAGAAHDGSGKGGTVILTGDGVSAFRFDASRCKVTGIFFLAPEAPTKLADRPIALDFLSGSNHEVDACRFTYFLGGVYFRNCDYWTLTNNHFTACSEYMVLVANAASVDAGDQTMMGNNFLSAQTGIWAGKAQVHQESAGGTKVVGNKFLGGPVGYEVQAIDGVDTSILMVTGNSFETHIGSHIKFTAGGGSNTGKFAKVSIGDNQFSPWNVTEGAITIAGASQSQYYDIVIADNVFEGTSHASKMVTLSGCSLVRVWDNSFSYGLSDVTVGGNTDEIIVRDNACYAIDKQFGVRTPLPAQSWYKNDWTADYAANYADSVILVEPGVASTVRLPEKASIPPGHRVRIVNTGGMAVTVTPNAADAGAGVKVNWADSDAIPATAYAAREYMWVGNVWITSGS